MTSVQHHIIGRLQLAIDVDSKRGADLTFDQANKTSRLFLEQLGPLLDDFAPADQLIKFDKLVFNLGEINERDFSQQLVNKLIAELKIVLQATKKEERPAAVPTSKAHAEALHHYFSTGTIPWWQSPEKWAKGLEEQLFLLDPKMQEIYLQKWLSSPAALDRLQQQLSATALAKVNKLLWGTSWLRVKMVLEEVSILHQQASLISVRDFEHLLQRVSLRVYAQNLNRPSHDWNNFASFLWPALAAAMDLPLPVLIAHFRQLFFKKKSVALTPLQAGVSYQITGTPQPAQAAEKLFTELGLLLGKTVTERSLPRVISKLSVTQRREARVILRNWLRWLALKNYPLAQVRFVSLEVFIKLLLPPVAFKILTRTLAREPGRKQQQEQTVLQYLARHQHTIPTTETEWQAIINKDVLLFGASAPQQENEDSAVATDQRQQQTHWELLSYFLTNGYLLFNQQITSQAALEEWLCQQLEAANPYPKTALKNLLHTGLQRERFTGQFSLGTQWATVLRLADIPEEEVRFTINFLQTVLPLLFPKLAALGPPLLATSIDFWVQTKPAEREEEAAFLEHLLAMLEDQLPLKEATVLEQLQIITEYAEWQALPAVPLAALKEHLSAIAAKRVVAAPALPIMVQQWLAGEQEFTPQLEEVLLQFLQDPAPALQKMLLNQLREVANEQLWEVVPPAVIQRLLPLAAIHNWPQWKLLLDDLSVLHWEADFFKVSADLWLKKARKSLIHFLFSTTSQAGQTALFWQHWIKAISQHTQQEIVTITDTYTRLAAPALQANILSSDLRHILPALATSEKPTSKRQPSFSLEDEQEALLYFLKNGRFLKQEVLNATQLNQAFQRLIKEHAASLRSWFKALPPQLNITDRLLDHFSTALLQSLLEQVLIKDFTTQGKLVLATLQHWAQEVLNLALPENFTLAVAIDYSRSQAPTVLHDILFLKYFLQRLTTNFSISPQVVWNHLPVLETTSTSRALKQAVGEVLRTLSPQAEEQLIKWLTDQQELSPEISLRDTQQRSAQDAFFFWLRYGRDPWWKTDKATTTNYLTEDSPVLDEGFKTLLQQHWALPGVQQRLSEQLPQAERRILLEVFLDVYTPFALVALETGQQALAVAGKTYPSAWYWKQMLRLAMRTTIFSSTTFTKQWFELIARRSGSSLSQLHQQALEVLSAETGSYQQRLAEIIQELAAPSSSANEITADGSAKKTPPAIMEEETTPPAATEKASAVTENKDSTLLPPRERLQQLLIILRYYLRYGSLPAPHTALSKQQVWAIFDQLLADHPKLLRQAITDLLGLSAAVDRLLEHTTPADWHQIAFLLIGRELENLNSLRQEWEEALAAVLPIEQATLRERKYYRHFLLHLGQSQHKNFQLLAFTASLLRKWSTNIKRSERELLAMLQDRIQLSSPEHWPTLTTLLPALNHHLRKEAQRATEQKKLAETISDQPSIEEAIYIHNAGLVILAPFFKRFFDTLNMLDSGKFQDINTATRAVHLLQNMVTGREETPEHLLAFNKVLCGLPINLPVPLSIDITQEEADLVDFLFQSVLQNWEIMKNSTIENLRGAFIIRDGRLVEEEDRWVLTVEPKSYDITLDYLPWTISVIQLPWMEKRLEVDWKTKA